MHRQFRCFVAIDVVAPVNYLEGDGDAIPALVANGEALSIRIEYMSSEGDGDSVG